MEKDNLPQISIITPSFNQGNFIEQNILSVLDQNYPHIEHIVIDGGSTDETLDILKKYPHLIWISEKDHGQADALNKGLRLATGSIIGWLNSDDLYYSNIFSEVVEIFTLCNCSWLIGNVEFLDMGSNTTKTVKIPPITYESLRKKSVNVLQPSAFFSKNMLVHAGGFNEDLYLIIDYELYLRLTGMGYKPLMIDKILAVFRLHNQQKTNIKNSFRQIKELYLICTKHGAYKAFLKKAKSNFKNIIKYHINRSYV